MNTRDDTFPIDTTGLPAAAPTPSVELSNGDRFDLRIVPVAQRIGDAVVRRLAYKDRSPVPRCGQQGSEIVVQVANDGAVEATVHWHGARLENRYDGVPHETQRPISVGGALTYRVRFPDPGLYWYHPHLCEDYAQDVGLSGNIIVEPSERGYWPAIDREVVLWHPGAVRLPDAPRCRQLGAGTVSTLRHEAATRRHVLNTDKMGDQMTMMPIAIEEADATVAALKPPKRRRPTIAIIGINDATEATDYLMPYGILRRADVADVVALATRSGPVRLYPALQVETQATIEDFDARHPDGADYVIVPAMTPDDDRAALRWIKAQAAVGAIVIGVCAGAMVVGNAGLLDDRRATTHWFFVRRLRRRHPAIYVADRRLVVDEGIATTTGITATMPMSLTLIEAIAGRDRAESVARDLGVGHWDARHDSASFRVTPSFAWTVVRNRLVSWKQERLGIQLRSGVDEVSLALVADAWSRTYRARAMTFASRAGGVETMGGIRVIPDDVAPDWPADRLLPAVGSRPAMALEEALRGIVSRYGTATAEVVATQLEYPWPKAPR